MNRDQGTSNSGTPMGFWRRRELRKAAIGLLRHVGYARSMREDVASRPTLERMEAEEQEVRQILKSRRFDILEARLDRLSTTVKEIMPPRSWPTLREYVEIGTVALGVAMACRSYFLQPFKIPSGSMQPTLHGINYRPAEKSGMMDTVVPLKCAKWLVTGEWYFEARASRAGYVEFVDPNSGQPYSNPIRDGCYGSTVYLKVTNSAGSVVSAQTVFENTTAHVKHGDYVVAGQLLASGIRIAGDHVFVDTISWNFRKPRRSEVMVFLTTGIHPGLPQDTYYIKRMVGLPGDSVTIAPPRLLVDGNPVTEHTIGAIGRGELQNVYGYRLGEPRWRDKQLHYHDGVLTAESPTIQLKAGQYLACGDNTGSSQDSRYWGPVPRERLVGPAFIVYWPFSKRWGLISR